MKYLRVIALLLLPAFVGCERTPTLVPVTGTVKLDGKPVAGVTVTFMSDSGDQNSFARGKTDSQGEFVLRFRDRFDGAPVGRYKVTLSTERQDTEGAETFSYKYHDPDQTILSATVAEGGSRIDLEAKSSLPLHPPRTISIDTGP